MNRFAGFRPTRKLSPTIAMSPDGSRVAYCDDATGQINLAVAPTDGTMSRQLTNLADRSVRQVCWHPGGGSVFFTADKDGDEFHQIFSLSVESGDMRQLTDAPAVQHFLAAEAVSPDGRFLAYCANDDVATNQDASILDIATGQSFRVLALESAVQVHGWSPDGAVLLACDIRGNTDIRPYVVAIGVGADGEVTPGEHFACMPEAAGSNSQPIGMLGTGSPLLVLSDVGRDFTGLAAVDLDDRDAPLSSRLTWLVTPEWDVEHAALAAQLNRLAWTVNVDGRSELHARDTATGVEIDVPVLPPGVVSALSISADGRKIAVVIASPTRPANLAVVDLDASTLSWLTDIRAADADQGSMTDASLVRFTADDRRDISAYLYRPPGTGPFPVVLSIHGGPEDQERPGYQYAGFYQYLLSSGIGILAPNVRGSTGYGAAFQKLIHRDWGGDELRDFASAHAYLTSLDWVDPTRIGVFGASYGGFAVLSCLSRLPALFAVGVDIVGPSNLVTLATSVPPTWRRLMADWLGDPEKDFDFLMSRSPVTYASDVRAPLFVIQGANDPRVNKAESDQIVALLRERGIPVRYDVYADEGHGFTRRSNELQALSDAAEFLIAHLGADREAVVAAG